MRLESTIQIWLTSALLGVGILIFLLGLWILLLPTGFLQTGRLLGKWINTDEYFHVLDKPRYQESLIYRHHRIAGGLILLGAAYTLVVLVARADVNSISLVLPTIINSFLSGWLYGALYSLLVIFNMFAIVVGVIIILRPSALKGIESTLNRWIQTDSKLKTLDEPHEISVDVFPGGNPRLFGLAVALAGLYILLSMAVVLL